MVCHAETPVLVWAGFCRVGFNLRPSIFRLIQCPAAPIHANTDAPDLPGDIRNPSPGFGVAPLAWFNAVQRPTR
jgi:hypothetical protein